MRAKQSVPVTARAHRQSLFLSTPVFLALELTAQCNNRCPGCGNVFTQNRSRQPLSAGQWTEIIESLSPYATRLKITGGEPTLHPEFERILRAIQRVDISFTLFTNARWSDPNALVRLLRSIPQCTGLLISLHGATAASHDAFTRVPGSFDEVCANVQLAVTGGLSVTTSTVITSWNWAELHEIVSLSQMLGAHHAVFNRYLGGNSSGIEPKRSELEAAIATLERIRASNLDFAIKFGNCIPQCFARSSSSGCLAGVAYCTIDPWGNVRPCNHAPLLCGNLLEQPMKMIWNGAGMEEWRSLVPAQCWLCSEIPHCHGGCRAVAMLDGKARDSLMRVPLRARRPPEYQILTLHNGARPVRRFVLREESFGFVLIRGSRILPIAKEARVLLDVCDGTRTLLEIRERLGQGALDFIGELYERGLVELEC
jgi:radical SAM protein with 4Fe4S-binding SPASM domain